MTTLPGSLDDPDYVPEADEFDPERDSMEPDDDQH